MQTHFITYGDNNFEEQRKRITYEAAESQYFHSVYGNSRDDIKSFYLQHKHFIDNNSSGAGYWIWKPYIIYQSLFNIKENDILVYADAGCSFVNKGKDKECRDQKFKEYIDILTNSSKPIIAFSPWTWDHATPDYLVEQTTKMHILKYFNLQNDKVFAKTPSLEAGVIFLRKTPIVMNVIKMWLDLVLYDNYSFVNDALFGETENKEFVVPRHDQSVLNVLFYLFGLHRIDGSDLYGAGPIFAGRLTDRGQNPQFSPATNVI